MSAGDSQARSSLWRPRFLRVGRHLCIYFCGLLAILVGLDWYRSFHGFASCSGSMDWPPVTVAAQSQDGYFEVSFRTPAKKQKKCELPDCDGALVSDFLTFPYPDSRQRYFRYSTGIPLLYRSYIDSAWMHLDGEAPRRCDPDAPPIHVVFSEHWFGIVASLALGLLFLSPEVVVWAKRKRYRGGCRGCGYDLRASPVRCPECGKGVVGC